MSQEPTSPSIDDAAPETSSRTSRGLMALLLLLAPVVAYAGWSMWEVDRAAAIGCLKVINISQTLYREGGKGPAGPNGELMYAPSLQELAKLNLIDQVLGSGVKSGYTFELKRADGGNGSFIWSAVARPKVPTPWAMKALYTDQSGVIFEVDLDTELTVGKPPPGATPLK